MKKKLLAFTLAAAMAMPMTGVYATEAVEIAAETEQADAAVVSGDQFVTTGYLYETEGATVYFVMITNNSDTTVSASGTATAYDASGAELDETGSYLEAIAPGETQMCGFYFSATGVDSAECNFTFAETQYQGVVSNLEITEYPNAENETIAVTNNGDVQADYVCAYALFLDDSGAVVGMDYSLVSDTYGGINPGETIYQQLNCPDGYNTVVVGLSGYADAEAADTSTEVDASKITYKEFKEVCEELDEVTYYLPLYNNLDQTVSVWGNAVAKDAAGNVIGAATLFVDCIGSGETTMGDFDFFHTGDIDHIEYTLHAYADTLRTPVVTALETVPSMDGQTLTINVTNHGSLIADGAEVYALAMDEKNNVVDSGYGFAMDDNCEITSGSTASVEFTIAQTFDHIDIYLVCSSSEEGENQSDYTNNGFTRYTVKGTTQETISVYDAKAETTTTTTTEAAKTTTTEAAKTTTTEAPATTTTEAPAATTTEAPTTEAPTTEAPTTEAPAEPETVTPEFKAKMDQYVDWFSNFVAYVYNYQHSDETYQQENAEEYGKRLEGSYDMEQMLQSCNDGTLSNADLAYYSDTRVRVDSLLRQIE